MGPGKAEAAGHGGSMSKADNTAWLHLGRNPGSPASAACWGGSRRDGRIFPIAVSLVAKIHPVFVTPRSLHSAKSATVAASL